MAEGGIEPKETPLHNVVTCSVSFVYMSDSKILVPCMHSFCTGSVSRLDKKRKHGQVGVECPLCCEFIIEKDIRINLTLNQMVELIIAEQEKTTEGGKVCIQCSSPDITSKCLQCNIELCQNCKVGHCRIPRFKQHKVLPISEASKINLKDTIIFCSIHPSEEIKMNCKTCDIIICNTCKFEKHDSHISESVHSSMKRYHPVINVAVSSIIEKIDAKKQIIANTDQQCKLLEDNCEENEQKLTAQKNKIIIEINKQYTNLQGELRSVVGSQIKQLRLNKEELEHSVASDNSLITWTKAITENTDGGGLLREFQSRLLQKIKSLQQGADNAPVTGGIKLALFVPSQLNLNDSILGKFKIETNQQQIVENTKKISGLNIGINITGSSAAAEGNKSFRHTSFNISSLTNKTLTKCRNFNVPVNLIRFCIFKDKIWLPGNTKLHIKIFSLEGDLMDNVELYDIKRPISLHPFGPDQLVLAAESGLYLLNNKGQVPSTIHTGYFHDVCVQGDIMAAVCYDLNNSQVYLYEVSDLSKPKLKFPVQNGSKISTLCMNKSYVYFCDCSGGTVHKYNVQGQHLDQFGMAGTAGQRQLKCPKLCMTDTQGNVLVADNGNHQIQVFSASGERLSALKWKFNFPYYAVIISDKLYVLEGSNIKLYKIQ